MRPSKAVGAIGVGAAALLAAQAGAEAYQVPGSNWTWWQSDNIRFASSPNRTEYFQQTNNLDWACYWVSMSGYSYGDGDAETVNVQDGYDVGSWSGSVSFPPGLAIATSAHHAEWDETFSGQYATKTGWYVYGNKSWDNPPIKATVGKADAINSVGHTTTNTYRTGTSAWYGPSTNREEPVC